MNIELPSADLELITHNSKLAQRLSAALAILTGVLLLPRLLIFAQMGASMLAWPWQFDYDEGINLSAAYQLATGHNIYQHNGPDSFISSPYPPFLFILNAPFLWITGPSLTPGRVIAVISTLALPVFLFVVISKATSSLPDVLV